MMCGEETLAEKFDLIKFQLELGSVTNDIKL